VQLRVSGGFSSVEEIRNFPIRAGRQTFRLGDVATVRRGFADPAAPRMRFLGKNAIGIAVSMKPAATSSRWASAGERVRPLQKHAAGRHAAVEGSDQPAAVRDRWPSSCDRWPRRWRSCCW
jgi:multidrug efflux pump